MKLNELILKLKQIEEQDTQKICYTTPNGNKESLDSLSIGFSGVNDPEEPLNCYPHIVIDTTDDTSMETIIDKLENIAVWVGNPDVMLHDCGYGLWHLPEEVEFV